MKLKAFKVPNMAIEHSFVYQYDATSMTCCSRGERQAKE